MRKKELAVGDSTDVELIFNTGHYVTKVNKSASIICNAPGMTSALNFSAHPIKDVDSLTVYRLRPALLALDSVRPEEQKHAWEYEVALKNVSNEELEFELVSSPFEYVKIDMPGGGIAPGKEKTIKIKVDKGISENIFSKSFTIEASDSAKTRYTFPIQKAMRWGPAPTSSR